jgi:hypothetical protein
VGRNTFEAFREFWPRQTDDPTGVRDYLNAVRKYVVSNTLVEPGWEHTTVLRGNLLEEVQALKAAPGRDIVATGSVQLVQALIAAGLVDEYRLPRRRRPWCATVRVGRHVASAAGDAALYVGRRPAPLCHQRQFALTR